MSFFRVICLFAVAVALHRILINAYRLYRLQKIQNSYKLWHSSNNPKFLEYKQELVSLFKNAGLPDGSFPIAQEADYGLIAGTMYSAFMNVQSARPEFVSFIASSFSSASGVFKKRIFDTINPLCWVEAIVFLPRHILLYLGVKPESIVNRIFLILWWVATPFAIAFRDNLYNFIIGLLEQL